jgi:ribosomal 50S subunit-recycling heat shock protein
MEQSVRLDVALNRLCLTRSRSEAKHACETGAVLVAGRPAKASQIVQPGDTVTLRFTNRLLEVRIREVPRGSIAKRLAREMYEVVRDERIGEP